MDNATASRMPSRVITGMSKIYTALLLLSSLGILISMQGWQKRQSGHHTRCSRGARCSLIMLCLLVRKEPVELPLGRM
jgi:hypothetical protein